MNNEGADMDSVITTFNIAVTETASEILGKHRQKKKKRKEKKKKKKKKKNNNKKTGSLQEFLNCATKGEN